MKKIISLFVALLLTLTLSPAPANAARCTNAELAQMSKVWDKGTYLYIMQNGPGELFNAIDKAKASTKKKSLKKFYSKLASAVERQGRIPLNLASQMLTKLDYRRC